MIYYIKVKEQNNSIIKTENTLHKSRFELWEVKLKEAINLL